MGKHSGPRDTTEAKRAQIDLAEQRIAEGQPAPTQAELDRIASGQR